MKRVLTLLMVLLFCVSTVDVLAGAEPQTILLIDDCGLKARDGTVLIENPEGALKYNDSPLVWFLEDLGYNVDTRGMAQTYWTAEKNNWKEGEYGLHNGIDLSASQWWEGQDWRLQAMLDADIIIMSRHASSGRYKRDDAEASAWNGLEVPLLTQNGHLARSGKWGWNTADKDKQSDTLTTMQMGAEDIVIFDYTVLGGTTGHPPQSPVGDYPAEAVVEAMFDGFGFMVDIPAGVDLDALNETDPGTYGVTGADRYYFGIWGYDGKDESVAGYDWAACTTDAYKALFADAVAQTIPEPTTIALLGLGGLALLRRRK
jgi:hypothetical protein